MSLSKFPTETVDDLIFDAIEPVRGRYLNRPDKNAVCKYLNVSTEIEKLYIEDRIDILLELNKIRNKKPQGSDLHFIIPMNSEKQVKQIIAVTKMILKVV